MLRCNADCANPACLSEVLCSPHLHAPWALTHAKTFGGVCLCHLILELARQPLLHLDVSQPRMRQLR